MKPNLVASEFLFTYSEKTAGNPQSSCCWRNSNFAYTPHFWYISCKNCRFSSRAFGHPWWHLLHHELKTSPDTFSHSIATWRTNLRSLSFIKWSRICSTWKRCITFSQPPTPTHTAVMCITVISIAVSMKSSDTLMRVKSSSDKTRRLLRNADAPIPVYTFLWRSRNLHCRE